MISLFGYSVVLVSFFFFKSWRLLVYYLLGEIWTCCNNGITNITITHCHHHYQRSWSFGFRIAFCNFWMWGGGGGVIGAEQKWWGGMWRKTWEFFKILPYYQRQCEKYAFDSRIFFLFILDGPLEEETNTSFFITFHLEKQLKGALYVITVPKAYACRCSHGFLLESWIAVHCIHV